MGTDAGNRHSSLRPLGRRFMGSALARRWLKLPLAFTAGAAIVVVPVDRTVVPFRIETVGEVQAPEDPPEPATGSVDSSGVLAASNQAAREATVNLRAVPGRQPTLSLDLYSIAIEVSEAQTTETTGAAAGWVEPEIESEGEWVDVGNGVRLPDVLVRIRFCESTNDYGAANAYSTARGAYQFLTKSWVWYGHAERYGAAQAHLATPAQQDEAALLTLQQDGARPWAESRHCWDDANIVSNYASARPPTTTTTTAPAPSTTTTTATSEPGPDSTTTTTIEGEPTTTTTGTETTTTVAPTS